MSQGSFNTKISFLGQKVCLAVVYTHKHTHGHTHSGLCAVCTLSGFHDVFLQSIIKDRPNTQIMSLLITFFFKTFPSYLLTWNGFWIERLPKWWHHPLWRHITWTCVANNEQLSYSFSKKNLNKLNCRNISKRTKRQIIPAYGLLVVRFQSPWDDDSNDENIF